MDQHAKASRSAGKAADLREMGQSVRRARAERATTLEDLAARAGISKSVLSQVERGLTNPTLSTVWAIAAALELDPLALLGQAFDKGAGGAPTQGQISHKHVPVIENRGDRYRLLILNAPELAGRVEIYQLVLDPGGALISSAHARDATEDFTVLDGHVEISSGRMTMVAGPDETLSYAADTDHAIRAIGPAGARGILVVTFRW